MSKSQKSVLQ